MHLLNETAGKITHLSLLWKGQLPKLSGAQIQVMARTVCLPHSRAWHTLIWHCVCLHPDQPAMKVVCLMIVLQQLHREVAGSKGPLLPYLLAVWSSLLSGSRVPCRNLQGDRTPHQTGTGPWSSRLPSSGPWGNTPWLAHSLPVQPEAGRLRKKGGKRKCQPHKSIRLWTSHRRTLSDVRFPLAFLPWGFHLITLAFRTCFLTTSWYDLEPVINLVLWVISSQQKLC